MISTDLLTQRNFSWFDVQEPGEEDFNTLSLKLGLPSLLIQDTLRPEHLPKYEFIEDGGHFLMMRTFDPESSSDSTTVQDFTRKIALFITTDRLITIHRVSLEVVNKIAQRCRKNEQPKTLQALVHSLILHIIRSYEVPLMRLQATYDEFEEEILSKKSTSLDTTKIYIFRRQLFVIKRILKQTLDALYRSKDFWVDHSSMLQDLRENVDQIYYQLDEISDNFDHLFQLHISLNDQRANEVMKLLTVSSSILLPLNFIASFYGMNFVSLPGLHSHEALLLVVILMILISLGAVWYFRSKGWFKTARE
jgi:magnesium transporter